MVCYYETHAMRLSGCGQVRLDSPVNCWKIQVVIMQVPVWDTLLDNAIRQKVRSGQHPVVLKNLVRYWPIIDHGFVGFDSVADYLLKYDQGKPFQAMIAPASAKRRLFYSADMKGFNFDRMNGELSEALKILKVLSEVNDAAPSFYIGSKSIAEYLSGMEIETRINGMGVDTDPTIWISNQAIVATHNDYSENIACVAVGRRRFTLFPPDQEENLYLGPPDLTPAGRPISLVDLNSPDFNKYPLFSGALKTSQVAELEPGDAIYIPTSWWHHVEALDNFNILINFWWRGEPPMFPDVY